MTGPSDPLGAPAFVDPAAWGDAALPADGLDELEAEDQLVLGDLLNHVLDKGVVISGQVTISIANIDLVALDLRLILSSVESAMQRAGATGPTLPEAARPTLGGA